MTTTDEITTTDELVADADRFAAALATELADEPALRYQGMPSDGDSARGYRALGEAGWIGVHWPTELGGRGLTSLDTLVCEERFGYHWLPLSSYLLSVKTIGNALLRFASPELQRRLIPGIAAGEIVFCQGFSEPDAGSDLGSLRTTARRDGDRFIVNGRKIWTSSAEYANWVYLAVRTDPDRPQASRRVGAGRAAGLAGADRALARHARRRHDRRARDRGRRDLQPTNSSGSCTAAGGC